MKRPCRFLLGLSLFVSFGLSVERFGCGLSTRGLVNWSDMADEEQPAQASWKNRRRMAWGAFLSLIVIVTAMLYHIMFKGGDPTSWTGIAGTIITAFGAIVVGYTGFAVWDDISKNKK